jgi:hypothetical protein
VVGEGCYQVEDFVKVVSDMRPSVRLGDPEVKDSSEAVRSRCQRFTSRGLVFARLASQTRG